VHHYPSIDVVLSCPSTYVNNPVRGSSVKSATPRSGHGLKSRKQIGGDDFDFLPFSEVQSIAAVGKYIVLNGHKLCGCVFPRRAQELTAFLELLRSLSFDLRKPAIQKELKRFTDVAGIDNSERLQKRFHPDFGGRVIFTAPVLHFQDPSAGCPLAALGSEIARCDEKTRTAATQAFLELVNIIAAESGKTRPDVARRRARVAAATMIRALTISRIVTDSELSASILREARKQLVDRRLTKYRGLRSRESGADKLADA
jgi:hypothetical protein